MIGTVLPVGEYGIVKNDFKNVPAPIPGSHVYSTPGPTRPEQYFEPRVVRQLPMQISVQVARSNGPAQRRHTIAIRAHGEPRRRHTSQPAATNPGGAFRTRSESFSKVDSSLKGR